MLGTFFPPPRVSDPDMYHATYVTRVPWCIPGSLTSALTSGFLWSRWRGKRSLHSRRMGHPQFYVSGKRPMEMLSNGTLVKLTPHYLYNVQNSQQMYCISHYINISYAYINHQTQIIGAANMMNKVQSTERVIKYHSMFVEYHDKVIQITATLESM